MERAGQMALNSAAKASALSYSTAATVGERWGQFTEFAQDELGIKSMEGVTAEAVVAYGEGLQARVEAGEMTAATAQNYVSAVNSVMILATQGSWERVSPTRDCGIDQRSGIATDDRAISHERHAELREAVSARLGVLMDLQRELGLRFEESAKLDARAGLNEARETGTVTIDAGTKGGLEREVPVSPGALAALDRAAEIQGDDRSMIPGDQSYASYQSEAYRELREAGGDGFHGERHACAQDRYQYLTGAPAPFAAGWDHDERIERMAEHLGVSEAQAREIDREAREQVAEELGHGREEVTNAYLG